MGAQIFLGVSALVWLPYGIFCLLQPSFLEGAAGVAASTATGTVELRAMPGAHLCSRASRAGRGLGRRARE